MNSSNEPRPFGRGHKRPRKLQRKLLSAERNSLTAPPYEWDGRDPVVVGPHGRFSINIVLNGSLGANLLLASLSRAKTTTTYNCHTCPGLLLTNMLTFGRATIGSAERIANHRVVVARGRGAAFPMLPRAPGLVSSQAPTRTQHTVHLHGEHRLSGAFDARQIGLYESSNRGSLSKCKPAPSCISNT